MPTPGTPDVPSTPEASAAASPPRELLIDSSPRRDHCRALPDTPQRGILKHKSRRKSPEQADPPPDSPPPADGSPAGSALLSRTPLPKPRSEGVLTTLTACSMGHTSPRMRRQAQERSASLLSVWDAAWEGDTEGLDGLLRRPGHEEDIDKLGYLQPHSVGLCYTPADPLKGFHLTAAGAAPQQGQRKGGGGGYSAFAATPLMFAAAARRTETVEYLLAKGAQVNVSAELISPGGGGATLRDIAFSNTFFRCSGQRETEASRRLKSVVYSALPGKGCALTSSLAAEQIAMWLNASCGVSNKDFTFGRWSPLQWVSANGLTGVNLEMWLFSDWKEVGVYKLDHMKRLLPHLLLLIQEGLPRGVLRLLSARDVAADAVAALAATICAQAAARIVKLRPPPRVIWWEDTKDAEAEDG